MGLTFRFSKKLILIMSGIVVLGGGSGAAAVFVGADKLLGPSYLEMNGFECTSLETIKIKRDQRYWVRKYVTSEEPGDGMARIRTALRVARAVQEKEKADLVQVAMIDKAGPKDRALMRGRMIGAQVIYIPDPGKMPKGTAASVYSAYYLDGSANASGEYYGMRIDLPVEDVETVTARLTDHADCVEPVAAVLEGAHGAPAGGHGEPSGGHGESSGAHGAEPAAGGHEAPAEGHGDVEHTLFAEAHPHLGAEADVAHDERAEIDDVEGGRELRCLARDFETQIVVVGRDRVVRLLQRVGRVAVELGGPLLFHGQGASAPSPLGVCCSA